MIITKKFEVLGYAGLCWPSLAFLAFVALDDFLKQKLAFVDKIQAQLTCFQQSDVKTNYQTRSGILKHCDACPCVKYNTLNKMPSAEMIALIWDLVFCKDARRLGIFKVFWLQNVSNLTKF